MPSEKQTENPKKIICLKTKQNTEMSDEEHSDSEFYYPEEHEMAEEWMLVAVVAVLTKLKQAETPGWDVSSGCIDFHSKSAM